MNLRYRALVGTGLSMAVAGLMLGGTAFAAGTTKFAVTGSTVQSVQTSGGQTTIDVAITVEDTGIKSGTWTFPTPSDANLPTIKITDETTNTALTGDFRATTLVSNPDPTVTSGQSATAVYAFAFPTPASSGDHFSIQLTPSSGNSNLFHMYNGKNTAPVADSFTLYPVGQLPEVPFAVGIPLVGVGIGGLVWFRKRTRRAV